MKKIMLSLLAVAALAGSGLAYADADDAAWTAQCVKDNKDEGAKPDVVLKYCQCMVNEMDSNDSRSVTQFEKANPKTMKMCERKAGWK